MNGAFALDVADYLRHCVLRWNRNHHVHVIRHQVPFLNPALSLRGKTPEYFSQMLPQFHIQRSSSAFGYENDVVFAVPLRMA
jgi:hypothetical protein